MKNSCRSYWKKVEYERKKWGLWSYWKKVEYVRKKWGEGEKPSNLLEFGTDMEKLLGKRKKY